MTAGIWWKFAVVKNGLPEAYSGLFTVQVQRLFKGDGTTQISMSQIYMEHMVLGYDNIRLRRLGAQSNGSNLYQKT